MGSIARKAIGVLVLTIAVAMVAQAQPPKRILILHSWGPEFGDLYARDVRAQLSRRLSGTCELYEQWLVSVRFAEPQGDAALASYLNEVFTAHPLDLVITLGAPAANFMQSHQELVFKNTPRLLADIEERRALASGLASNETAMTIAVSFSAIVKNILQVRPQTRTVAVVIGNSSIEKYWIGQMRDSFEPFADRVSLVFLSDLPFTDVLHRVATLPPQSAILYVLLSPHIEGVPFDENTALAQLRGAANSPMFSYTDAYLGKGIVGGPMISGEEQGRKIARAAERLLAGERASNVRMDPVALGAPVFDWRELTRWNIRESALPPASTVLFREPSLWERYRWQTVLVGNLLVILATLAGCLLYEHRRLLVAERNASQRMVELSHMNRSSTVGGLSAAITHELTQPLSAIGNNAAVAGHLLDGASPDLVELREITHDISRDQRRAIEVIMRLRGLFTKSAGQTQVVDLGDVLREVFELLAPHAFAHRVTLNAQPPLRPVLVRGDRVQLQQVILNVVMNSIDAIDSAATSERQVTGRSFSDGVMAEVLVEDTGPGLAADNLERIFEPFFTTKAAGMGMGLAIARSIVASQGGRIWAESRNGRGAVIRLTMPLANSETPSGS